MKNIFLVTTLTFLSLPLFSLASAPAAAPAATSEEQTHRPASPSRANTTSKQIKTISEDEEFLKEFLAQPSYDRNGHYSQDNYPYSGHITERGDHYKNYLQSVASAAIVQLRDIDQKAKEKHLPYIQAANEFRHLARTSHGLKYSAQSTLILKKAGLTCTELAYNQHGPTGQQQDVIKEDVKAAFRLNGHKIH